MPLGGKQTPALEWLEEEWMCYWASTAEVITCAESGGLSFHLDLEMLLKGPTYPPCYSCGEEFKKHTPVNSNSRPG